MIYSYKKGAAETAPLITDNFKRNQSTKDNRQEDLIRNKI